MLATTVEPYENELSYTQNPSYNAVRQNMDHTPNDTTTPVYLNNNAFSSVVCDTAKKESLNHTKSDLKSLCHRHCSWVCVGLVVVGVMACVSMVMAVWSIAKVHSIENKSNNIGNNIGNSNNISNNAPSIPGSHPSVPADSCSQLLLMNSPIPSGQYWVRASNGSAVLVFCDMTRSCGGVTGGWVRVASLDINNTSSSCPSGLRLRVDSGIRSCGIQSSGATCASSMFSTSGVEYTRVCGKVLAYQFSSTDAFHSSHNIDSIYVDGVSLTHGHAPREHIWTFAAALDEFGDDDDAICQCSHSSRSGNSSPSFVGQDYFCDSGVQGQFNINFDDHLQTGNPLWDGSGCGSDSTCCSFNNPPWFHKELTPSTNDDIEMRVCSDQSRSNEDVAIT